MVSKLHSYIGRLGRRPSFVKSTSEGGASSNCTKCAVTVGPQNVTLSKRDKRVQNVTRLRRGLGYMAATLHGCIAASGGHV